MTSDSGISGDIQDYPFLTKEEFAEACHRLDRRYTQATLGPIRRLWRLSTCTALDTTFVFDDAGYTTYVQITRPLEEQPDLDLSAELGNFSLASETGQADEMVMGDGDMMEAEDMDEAALVKKPRQIQSSGYVTYEIHLHPTYRAPCLWFSLHGLPVDEVAFSIDTVYRRLVPDQFKDVLRSAGGIGGISADHHPVTGVPCFFVHPCVLGEAMQSFRCTRENYLMIWLGFVGPTVGLWVPTEMAIG